jgi:hypothetical protein
MAVNAVSPAVVREKHHPYRAVLAAGLSAGVLDITAAFINTARVGRSPLWVLQSIASALLGADSYTGGLPTATLGACIHFTIALTIAAAYFLISRRLKVVRERFVICGLAYGAGVYFFMYGIVLRLAFHRNFLTSVAAVLTGLSIHMLCVGLPIALTFRWFSK